MFKAGAPVAALSWGLCTARSCAARRLHAVLSGALHTLFICQSVPGVRGRCLPAPLLHCRYVSQGMHGPAFICPSCYFMCRRQLGRMRLCEVLRLWRMWHFMRAGNVGIQVCRAWTARQDVLRGLAGTCRGVVQRMSLDRACYACLYPRRHACGPGGSFTTCEDVSIAVVTPRQQGSLRLA